VIEKLFNEGSLTDVSQYSYLSTKWKPRAWLPAGQDFSLQRRNLLCSTPRILSKAYRGSFLEKNRWGNEDNSLLSSAEVKNVWSCTSTLLLACMDKHRGKPYLYVRPVYYSVSVILEWWKEANKIKTGYLCDSVTSREPNLVHLTGDLYNIRAPCTDLGTLPNMKHLLHKVLNYGLHVTFNG
jgi:hypothetical protein